MAHEVSPSMTMSLGMFAEFLLSTSVGQGSRERARASKEPLRTQTTLPSYAIPCPLIHRIFAQVFAVENEVALFL